MTDAQHAVAVGAWLMCKDVSKRIWLTEPTPEYAFNAACQLMGTAAQESDSFRARRQYGNLPDGIGGYSLWQMEKAAIENGLCQIRKNAALEVKVASMVLWGINTTFEQAAKAIMRPEGDLFACILARLYYLRCPGAIPGTIDGQAAYWKSKYNTYAGAGRIDQYLDHWNHCCADIVKENP